MSAIYFMLIVLFAFPYWLASDACNLHINSFTDAMYFSMETMATIGYGLVGNNPFFDGCFANLPLIFIQSLVGIFYDTVALGLIFARLSRTMPRARG